MIFLKTKIIYCTLTDWLKKFEFKIIYSRGLYFHSLDDITTCNFSCSKGSWCWFVGGRGFRGRVILVVRECIWDALGVLLFLPTFDGTGSLKYPLRWVVYPPMGSTLRPASRFLVGNREAELKPTSFSSLRLFSVILFLFFPTSPRILLLLLKSNPSRQHS